ncbi:MAG: Y-family DNA polymerase [Simkaniaceae bacterium]|nr:MAG: Y-family DNA polymerase [Simkaniaceae bacterium]
MYALVDCNNFYASCEQVFNPSYRGKPLVVLSSNDGCIVARSKEAKKLGIPMGTPAFEHKSLFLQHNVIALSSNFALYGDMSYRVIETIKTFDLPIEIYSVDEVFLVFPEKGGVKLAKEVRDRVLQWTGITVSIGIAPTKTLAKVANQKAKKRNGIVKYNPDLLKDLPVEEIWGIGRRLKKRLHGYRIRYADELIRANDIWIKKHLSVTGLRTVMELRETPCIEHLEVGPDRKSIISSRSFGRAVTTLNELKEAIGTFTATAALKLRKESLKTHFLLIFIHEKRFKSETATIHLPLATSYTPDLIEAAHLLLEGMYQNGVTYKKGGVMLSELVSEKESQLDLFSKDKQASKKSQVIQALDQVNTHFGSKTLSFAAEGIDKKWKSNAEKRSPNYTTCWEEIPSVISKDK